VILKRNRKGTAMEAGKASSEWNEHPVFQLAEITAE
jgi:hypothetical protein